MLGSVSQTKAVAGDLTMSDTVGTQENQHPLMSSRPKNLMSNEEEEEILKEVVNIFCILG